MREHFDADLIADLIDQPPLGALRKKATHRRYRRMTALSVVAAGVVAAIAIAAPGGAPDGGVADPDRHTIADVRFFAPDTAVAVTVTDCAPRFARTTDAGRTWTPFRGPKAAALDCGGTGTPSARFQALDAQTYAADVDGHRYISTDAGLTWLPYDSVVKPVGAFPPGAQGIDCGSVLTCSVWDLAPYAVDPSTRLVYQLQDPGSAQARIESYWGAEGMLWAGLRTVDAISAGWSTDGGASWHTKRVDANGSSPAIAAVDHDHAYLVYPVEPTGGTGQPIHIQRTSDAGNTWIETVPDLPPGGWPLPVTATRSGDLLILQSAGARAVAWVSHDGTTFTEVPGSPTAPGLARGGGSGLLWVWPQGTGGAAQVTDGRTWTRVNLPT